MTTATNNVKISVIMPIYNVQKYLTKCIDSVLASTFEDIEIIAVNDGSTDDSGKILDKYAKQDKRIKAIHVANGGYGKAINLGLSYASGEYISIVETDDWIDQKMYEKLYEIALVTKADIIKGNFYIYASDTNINKHHFCSSIPKKIPFILKEHDIIIMLAESVWSAIYRHEFINKNAISFVETPGASYQDHPFAMEVYSKAQSIVFTDDRIYYYRNEYGQNNSTNQDGRKLFYVINQIDYALTKLKNTDVFPLISEAYYKKIFDIMILFVGNAKKELKKELWCQFAKFYNDCDIKFIYFNNFEKKCIKMMQYNSYEGYVIINKLRAIKHKIIRNVKNICNMRLQHFL